MLLPAHYTPPLSENFDTDADLLLEIVKLAYRDMDNDSLQLDEWQEWLLGQRREAKRGEQLELFE